MMKTCLNKSAAQKSDSRSPHSHNYRVGELIPVQRGFKKNNQKKPIAWPRISPRSFKTVTQSKQCIRFLLSLSNTADQSALADWSPWCSTTFRLRQLDKISARKLGIEMEQLRRSKQTNKQTNFLLHNRESFWYGAASRWILNKRNRRRAFRSWGRLVHDENQFGGNAWDFRDSSAFASCQDSQNSR